MLQKTKPFIPTYLKDSVQLIDLLNNLGPLPPNAKLFAADANSIYTNIDTDNALYVIGDWLKTVKYTMARVSAGSAHPRCLFSASARLLIV